VYDTVSGLAFGQSPGFVKHGTDVEHLIQSFHDMAPMAGLVGALPHIMNPILNAPVLGNWLMPHPGDGTGTGKIMQVRATTLAMGFAVYGLSNSAISFGIICLKTAWLTVMRGLMGTFWISMCSLFFFLPPLVDSLGTHATSSIMNAKNPDGSYMTDEEIKVEALVLMVAATDTTAAFVGSFVQNIISHPAVYQRLRAEIDSFESEGKLPPGIVSYEQAQVLPYFSACIRESLRFSPSTPFMMPRLVSKGGIEINGVHVPEGTEIGANPWVVHRDTKIFGADAAQFNPDRWLESEARSKEMDKYIMTWGYGARQCLGKNIAQMITQKLCLEVCRSLSRAMVKAVVERLLTGVVQLFRQFEFSCVDPEKPWREENLAIMVYYDHWLSIKPTKTSVQ
jgi:hypothetical protein